MPRSFTSWNDRRRPGAKLFSDIGNHSVSSPLILACGSHDSDVLSASSLPPIGSSSVHHSDPGPQNGGFEGLDMDDLVACLTDDPPPLHHSGCGASPMLRASQHADHMALRAGLAHAPLGMLLPGAQQLSQLSQLPQMPQMPMQADELMSMDDEIGDGGHSVACSDQCFPPLSEATAASEGLYSCGATGGASLVRGGGAPSMADERHAVAFEWTPCACPVRYDASGNPIIPRGSAPAGLDTLVELQAPLLYWNERQRWMWHKKWCLPRITVTLSELIPGALARAIGTDTPAVDISQQPLLAMISCGTLRAGHTELHDQGLSGDCVQRLIRTAGGQLEATFSSLLFQYTSFNCGNRPFYLFISLLSRAEDTLRPLSCMCSSPVHVDARKRTKGERPDARADDVRLAQRQRAQVPKSAPATLAQPAALATPYLPGHVLPPAAALGLQVQPAFSAPDDLSPREIDLLEATGCMVLVLSPDWSVLATSTLAPFGYPSSALVGGSLLQIMHPDEHLSLLQTTQALLATATSALASVLNALASGRDSQRDSLRVTHRVLMTGPNGHAAVAIDSTISVLRGGPAPRLLLASRYAVPIEASGMSAGSFRVYPARVPTIHTPVS